MNDAPEKPAKRARQGRSPAYPSVPLEEALAKARGQFEAEGKYAVPLSSAFKAWGYSEKSSGGRDVRASLRYFGLIAVEGDGPSAKVKLTEDALRVLLDQREDQTEKREIVRRLALNPTAHKKLWGRFPEGIKSDPTAIHYLVFDEGFNQSAAAALLAQFKQTATYAGLYEPDSMPDIPPPEDPGEVEQPNSPRDEESKGAHVGNRQRVPAEGKVTVMDGERVAFIEESHPGQYLKLIASGEVDDFMLEALEDYVKRQRRRLQSASKKEENTN